MLHRICAFFLLLLLSCSKAPVPTEDVVLEKERILIPYPKNRVYAFYAEKGWKVSTKALTGDLAIHLDWDGRDGEGFGVPSGRTELFTFSQSGIVELKVSPGTYPSTELDGITITKPVTPPPLPDTAVTEPLATKPNVLIYLVDTLRADAVGCYGGPSSISPNFDSFAQDATLYQNAVCPSSWTKPVVGSLFTGRSPRTHGANFRGESLLADYPTLAELLAKRGYQTGGFVTNPNLDPVFGFSRGFETYNLNIQEPSTALNQRVFQWLEGLKKDRPFFLYAHSVDPHHPYLAPAQFRERFAPKVKAETYFRPLAQPLDKPPVFSYSVLDGGNVPEPEMADDLRRLYEAEVAFNDETFGALLGKLKELELYESTLIVLVSDHGEEFYEHGKWLHGRTLYQEQLKVPLIVRFPGGEGAGRREARYVVHQDLFSTVLSLSGEVPEHDGRDLRLPERRRLIESYLVASDKVVREMVFQDGWKLIRSEVGDRPHVELYNLAKDPDEREDLAEARPARTGYLLNKFKELAEAKRGEAKTLTPEHEAQLRSLNYL